MPSKTQLMTIAMTLGALAVLNRLDMTRDLISGRTKFLGIF